jgi:type I restriction enzyme S subunit
VIPENWESVQLGSIANLYQPTTIGSALFDLSGFPVYGANGKIGSHKFYNHEKWQTTIACRGSCGDVNRTEDFSWINGNAMVANVDDNELVNKEFFYHLLKAQNFRNAITGSGIPQITRGPLAEHYLLLPPVEEQVSIGEVLSDADAAIESLDTLIAKKRVIRDAMLFDLVVSNKYKNFVSFKSDVSLKARIGWQGLTTGEYEISSDCYLVTGTDLNGGAVNWESCWQVAQKRYDQDPNIQLRNNDVLVTKDGTIGKVGFVADLSGKATLNSGVFVIRPTTKNLIPEYLRYVMFSPLFRRFLDRLAAGSTIAHLYQKDFVNFAFVVPAVDEQVVVSKMLDDVDSEIRTLIEQLTKLRMVKEGMMQDLLTGKARLV